MGENFLTYVCIFHSQIFPFTLKELIFHFWIHFSASESPFKYKWDVPVSLVTSNDASNVLEKWLYREKDECKYSLAFVLS